MMRLFLIGILSALSVHAASIDGLNEGYKSYKGYKVFKVQGEQGLLIDLINYFDEIYPRRQESIRVEQSYEGLEVIVAPDVLKTYYEAVKARQLNSSVEIDDFSEIIKKEKDAQAKSPPGRLTWTAYHDINIIYAWLKNVSQMYPDAAKLVVGGKTSEGRQILGLKILTPNTSGRKKPVVFIESGIHAREWIAPATTTYFINQLLTSKDQSIQKLRDSFEWHIFPSCNPDGYQYTHTTDRFWRKTRSENKGSSCKGVDPNRNFDYNWGSASTNPCHEVYQGPRVFSEIETKTLSEYISSLGQILAYLDFHSFVPCILIPYSDTTVPVHNRKDLVAIGNLSLDYGQKSSGMVRYKGPAAASEIMYSVTGSSMDWAVSKLKIPIGFVYELRGAGFHWPPEKIEVQGKEVTQMILGIFVKAKELGYY